MDDHWLEGLGDRVPLHDEEPHRPVIELGGLAVWLPDPDDVARAVVGEVDLGLGRGLDLDQPCTFAARVR